jgi:hypothetical protein
MSQIDNLGTTCDQKEKTRSKQKLGIDPNTICIIAIGTAEKFQPNANYNFYKTAGKIVRRFRNVKLYVIGVPESSYLRDKYNLNAETIHLVGDVTDPIEYYKAADISLDVLPTPSLGAIWISVVMGMCCPLLKYGITNVFNSNNVIESKLYEKFIGSLRNEKEYLKKLEFLISNPNIRFEIAKEIREHAIKTYSDDIITKHIEEMLDLANDIKHMPRMIPDGVYRYDNDSAEIASASLSQDLYSKNRYFQKYLNVRDEITIMLSLSTKFIYVIDVLKLALTILKNRITKLYSILFKTC